MLLQQLIAEYLTVHVGKLKSGPFIASCLRRYTPDDLLSRDLTTLEKRDFAIVHVDIGKHFKQAANAVLKNWSACLEYAVDENYLQRNPCRGITPFPAPPRKRFLSDHEITRLNEALMSAKPQVRAFIRMLLLTACRRDEARTVQWAHLDLVNGRWVKPTTKTTAHMTALPPELVADLCAIPRHGGYVFATANGKPWDQSWVHVVWREIRSKAGLDDVHIHDLRRTTATRLDQNGTSLSTIQKILNHRNMKTTQDYLVGLSVNDAVVEALNENAKAVGR